MLTCGGRRVARVCSADRQKMASKKASFGGSLMPGGKRISAEYSASGSSLSKRCVALVHYRPSGVSAAMNARLSKGAEGEREADLSRRGPRTSR